MIINRSRRLAHVTNNAYDSILLIEGDKVIGVWDASDPEIMAAYKDPGDLEDWDPTTAPAENTTVDDYGDVISYQSSTPLEDALAQVTASLKTLQGIYVRIAAALVRIPGEFVHGDREFIDREAVVAIALELKNASDGCVARRRRWPEAHDR